MTEPLEENLDTTDELIAERRSGALDDLPMDMNPSARKWIIRIDRLNEWVGQTIAWLVIPIFLIMVYEIVMRKYFTPTMWVYDTSRMLYGAMFMIGAGYALSRGVHIRADFLYRNWKPRNQARVDLILYLLFFFPGMLFFFYMATDFAWDGWFKGRSEINALKALAEWDIGKFISIGWNKGERGMDTAWMPHIGPIKATLPFALVFLILQGISESLKCWYAATRGKWPQ